MGGNSTQFITQRYGRWSEAVRKRGSRSSKEHLSVNACNCCLPDEAINVVKEIVASQLG